MHQFRRLLPFEPRPDLGPKTPLDLGKRRQRMKEAPEEPKPHRSIRPDQLESARMQLIDLHLAVADDAIAQKLEPGDAEVGDAHGGAH
jgi:hypothetical protein